jgi:hypothetical protein
MEKPLKERLFQAIMTSGLVKKTPPCSEELASAQLIPEKIEVSRFNGLTDRSGEEIYGKMIVDYKYINERGETIQVKNARVISSQLCVRYELPSSYGVNSFLNGIVGRDGSRSNCNDNYNDYIEGIIDKPVKVPFDVDITKTSIGKRVLDRFDKFADERFLSDPRSSYSIEDANNEKGGYRTTRKYKKKRVRGSKKRRGSVKRRPRVSSRKRK